jgi:hypothetical protein
MSASRRTQYAKAKSATTDGLRRRRMQPGCSCRATPGRSTTPPRGGRGAAPRSLARERALFDDRETSIWRPARSSFSRRHVMAGARQTPGANRLRDARRLTTANNSAIRRRLSRPDFRKRADRHDLSRHTSRSILADEFVPPLLLRGCTWDPVQIRDFQQTAALLRDRFGQRKTKIEIVPSLRCWRKVEAWGPLPSSNYRLSSLKASRTAFTSETIEYGFCIQLSGIAGLARSIERGS